MDVLDYLLTVKESESVELKEAHDKIPLSFYETYSSMANGSGGVIYLGIEETEPNNVILGITNANQKKKQLCNSLTMRTKISANLFTADDISIIETERGDVLKVSVKPVPIELRPVFLDGNPSRSYKRVDDGDKLLLDEEIQGMANDANKTKFDQMPNDYGFGMGDVDSNAVEKFVESIKSLKRFPLVEQMTTEDILSRVGALVFDKDKRNLVLTNGAVLFFGKSYAVNSVCPSLWMDYQEKGDAENRFSNRITIKDLEYEPNIYNFFSRVSKRLYELLPSPFYLQDGINVGKKMVEEIVREAVANAISNVELHSSNGLLIEKTNILLRIKNSGGLLTGLPQALKGGVSIPRNPCIFNFFLALGITDHGGYGIPSIFDRMKDLKMPVPTLEESWNRDETSLRLDLVQVSNRYSKEEQNAIMFLMSHPGGISSSSLAEHLGVSNETARQLLLRLIRAGEAADNGKNNKGRLYYHSSSSNGVQKKPSMTIFIGEQVKNHPRFNIKDLDNGDINSILMSTQTEPQITLYLPEKEERHSILRVPDKGYCALTGIGGLDDYSSQNGLSKHDVRYIGINEYVEAVLKDSGEIVLSDSMDHQIMTIKRL